MNAPSPKRPSSMCCPTSRVTARYMRLKQAMPSVGGSALSIASIRVMTSSMDTAANRSAAHGGGDLVEDHGVVDGRRHVVVRAVDDRPHRSAKDLSRTRLRQ